MFSNQNVPGFLYGLFLGSAVLGLSACGGEKGAGAPRPERKDGPAIVDVIIASPANIDQAVEAKGAVVASEFVELRPEVSGRLTYLNVPEGKFIAEGTVIARINDADLQAQLSKTRVLLELARQTEARLKKLLDVNGVNQADYDAALNQVNSLQADLVYTQALIDKNVVRAPFGGVTGLRQVSPGAYLTPTNVITTLQQVDQLKIDFTLPETYSDLVQPGATVEVVLDEPGAGRRRARILAREPQVDVNTRNLRVRALLEGKGGNPGSFAKIYLRKGSDKGSVLVPSNAIIPDATTKKMVTVRGGKAVFVDVETGVRQASAVEIVSGLQAGDTVVVSGVLFTRPNAPVQVREVKRLEDVVK